MDNNTSVIESAKKKISVNKIIKYSLCLFAVIAIICFIVSVSINSLQNSGVLPNKDWVKEVIEDSLIDRFSDHLVTDENVSLGTIHFDKIEAKKFSTRKEDTFGYFAYIERTIPYTHDGKNYESILDYYRLTNSNYDPETDVKWAYTISGTYEATHKEYGAIPGEYHCIYVFNNTQSFGSYVDFEYGTSLDVLRQDVKNNITSYLLVTYNIQPTPNVQITSIDKEPDCHTYTVYGKIVVRDKYDEEYTGKFTAKYKYNSYNHLFEKENMEVDELSKNLLADILK